MLANYEATQLPYSCRIGTLVDLPVTRVPAVAFEPSDFNITLLLRTFTALRHRRHP